MTERGYKLACVAAILAALAGAAVGGARWIGSDALVRTLEPVGRLPLYVGAVAPLLVYVLVQSLPDGRRIVWLGRGVGDGWAVALGGAALCASLAVWPARRETPPSLDVFVTVPHFLVITFFFIDRLRRVQRRLAAGPTGEGSL